MFTQRASARAQRIIANNLIFIKKTKTAVIICINTHGLEVRVDEKLDTSHQHVVTAQKPTHTPCCTNSSVARWVKEGPVPLRGPPRGLGRPQEPSPRPHQGRAAPVTQHSPATPQRGSPRAGAGREASSIPSGKGTEAAVAPPPAPSHPLAVPPLRPPAALTILAPRSRPLPPPPPRHFRPAPSRARGGLGAGPHGRGAGLGGGAGLLMAAGRGAAMTGAPL